MLFYLIYILYFPAQIDFQQTDPDVAQFIIGKWKWEETQLQSRGGSSTTTPESCACTKTLEIREDGTAILYKDGEVQWESVYEVEKRQLLNDPVRFEFRSHELVGTIRIIDNERLGIGAFGSCGQIHYYSRIQSTE